MKTTKAPWKVNASHLILAITWILLGCMGCTSSEDSTTDALDPDDTTPPQPTAFYDPAPAVTSGALASYVIRSKWQKTDLTYFIYSYASNLGTGDQQISVRQAFDAWANVTPLTFSEVGSLAQADIMIGFGTDLHCDLYDVRGITCVGGDSTFDGPGQLLAHAYFPGQGILSGESHFDLAESWSKSKTDGSGFSLLSVAMHEIGHALGLEHSADRNALMFPDYNGFAPIEALQADDVAGIQAIYGSGDGNVPPSTAPPPPSTPPSVPGCGASSAFDTDGDGVDDAIEQFYLGTNPQDCDTDGDGLTDAEVFAGLNPLNPDTDGDGASDGEEVSAGTNPFVPDQGGAGSYIPGRYIGFDSAGGALDFYLFADGTATGTLAVPSFFGPTLVPLFGGIDRFGQLVLLSYDYFFSLVGTPVPGGIQGQLQTASGGFASWTSTFAGSQQKGDPVELKNQASDDNTPKKDPWPIYQPSRGAKQQPTHRALQRVEWR